MEGIFNLFESLDAVFDEVCIFLSITCVTVWYLGRRWDSYICHWCDDDAAVASMFSMNDRSTTSAVTRASTD